jgi:hypothetical protein
VIPALAVIVLIVWAKSGVLAGLLALMAAAVVYCLVTLVNPVHRCPQCRGGRVTRSKHPRACRLCKGTGKTVRVFSAPIHGLAWTVVGHRARAWLEERNERHREEAGYSE